MPSDSLDLVGSGSKADVYAYGDGNVVKLFHTRSPLHMNELLAARTAHEAGFPGPRVIRNEMLDLDGREGIVFERVDGPTMAEHLKQCPNEAGACGRAMAQLHARVHTCAAPELHGLPEVLDWSLGQAETLQSSDREAVAHILHSLPGGQALCHGDMHPRNVLRSQRGWLVIDWEAACRGDPLADHARTWLISRLWLEMNRDAPEKTRCMLGSFWSAYFEGYRALRTVHDDELRRWQTVVAAVSLFWDSHHAPASRLEFVQASLANSHHRWLD